MSAYKVLKDFPSRNGVKQYEVGRIIQLGENSRTKALVEMGYIAKREGGRDLISRIALAVHRATGGKNVKIYPVECTDDDRCAQSAGAKCFHVEIDEVEE